MTLDDIIYHMYKSSGNSKYVLAGRKPLNLDIAKAQIKALFLELIGEDEKPHLRIGPFSYTDSDEIVNRNQLRKELRTKVEEL